MAWFLVAQLPCVRACVRAFSPAACFVAVPRRSPPPFSCALCFAQPPPDALHQFLDGRAAVGGLCVVEKVLCEGQGDWDLAASPLDQLLRIRGGSCRARRDKAHLQRYGRRLRWRSLVVRIVDRIVVRIVERVRTGTAFGIVAAFSPNAIAQPEQQMSCVALYLCCCLFLLGLLGLLSRRSRRRLLRCSCARRRRAVGCSLGSCCCCATTCLCCCWLRSTS